MLVRHRDPVGFGAWVSSYSVVAVNSTYACGDCEPHLLLALRGVDQGNNGLGVPRGGSGTGQGGEDTEKLIVDARETPKVPLNSRN